MIEWKCFELHTHTLHSDGNFSVDELRARAKDFLYDGIALTDHNTMSGLDELAGKAFFRVPEGIPVIPGIEWTTYYGHMLVIGADKYIDWRFVRADSIDDYTRAVKEAGGVIGIAHPFEMGSPMCTGCHWDFKVNEWKNIDYIEVWSDEFPQKRYKNELAFSWWTELLNKGHRIAASAGWDWHGNSNDPVLPAATWLGLENGVICTESVKEALASGRTIISAGPFPMVCLRRGESVFYPGDTLKQGRAGFFLAIDEDVRKKIWSSFGINPKRIIITHNGMPVKSFPCQSFIEEDLDLSPGWFRLEGYGDVENVKDALIFFSSPWYVN